MRLKIIAGNLAVVVFLGLIAYITVSNGIRKELIKRIDSNIGNDQILMDRSFQLAALTFTTSTRDRANSRKVRDVFAGLDVNTRRTRAYDAAEAVFSWFANPAHGARGAPDIVVIVDATGLALARNGAMNVMFGKKLLPTLPILKNVLKNGTTEHDVWLEDNEKKILQTAIAPIYGSSRVILGALIVGYDLSNAVAKAESKLLGRDVAFVIEDRVYSSSLVGADARELKDFLFKTNKASTKGILAGSSETSQIWHTSLKGQDYIGVSARLPMSASLPVAYVVLGNRTAQTSPASHANVIIYMLVLGAILVCVYGFAIGTIFMRPIEMIEEGVLAVINGRTDLRLDTDSPELGGLAYRINQLLNVFTGTEEGTEDDNGRVSTAPGSTWKEDELEEAPAAAKPAAAPPPPAQGASAGMEPVIDNPDIAKKLASEDENAYHKRIYTEYVQAKQQLGENVSSITIDRFVQRLKGRSTALVKQHQCRMIRFQVVKQNNQVSLQAVIIR